MWQKHTICWILHIFPSYTVIALIKLNDEMHDCTSSSYKSWIATISICDEWYFPSSQVRSEYWEDFGSSQTGLVSMCFTLMFPHMLDSISVRLQWKRLWGRHTVTSEAGQVGFQYYEKKIGKMRNKRFLSAVSYAKPGTVSCAESRWQSKAWSKERVTGLVNTCYTVEHSAQLEIKSLTTVWL